MPSLKGFTSYLLYDTKYGIPKVYTVVSKIKCIITPKSIPKKPPILASKIYPNRINLKLNANE